MASTRPKIGRPVDQALRSRRRREILDAATHMFADQGFSNTDLQLLANALGVGKGTVYRYFPTKRALFLAAADAAMHRLSEHIEAYVAGAIDPLDKVARAIRAYLEFFDTHPEYVELLVQERAQFKDRKKPTYFEHRDAQIGPWQALFRHLIDRGTLRDIPVERIINVIGELVYGTMFTNYFSGRHRTVDQQYRDIVDVVFHGILARERAEGATC